MKGRRWTTREKRTLRRLCATHTYEAIAAKLGRSVVAVKCAALRFGFAKSNRFTKSDLAYIERRLGEVPQTQIARQLGRSPSSVHQAVQRHFPDFVKSPVRVDAAFIARLRKLHADGWSDAEIAEDLGCERHTVGDHRKAMDLPHNAYSQRRRRRVGEKTRAQCRAAGVKSLGALRVKVFRERAVAAGWPDDLRPRAVQILNALWDNGPMTRRELADEIGMPWKGSRKSLVSNDPEGSYLAHLVKRGLVINLGRLRKGKGRGGSCCVYTLPLWIERNQPSTSMQEQHDAA